VSELLPIAEGGELRSQARGLGRRHRRALWGTVGLHAAAAAAGLAGPPLLGALVESVEQGTTRDHVDTIVLVLAGFLLVQTGLTWLARRASFVLSEKIFAELREDFMRRVLALPLSTVERAGTGDLVSRTTADVDSLARTIRFAVPETLIAAVTTILTVAAAVWVSPVAAIPCIAGVPAIWIGTRWYLKRAPEAYLRERATYATLAGRVGETVEGGRTIDALGLREERVQRIDDDLEEAYRAERRTLHLRTIWFPTAEFSYVLPVAAALAWGGWLVSAGHASLGEVTAVALYVVQLADPVDRLISWLDEIQVGATSFARLVGIVRVPPDRTATDDQPQGEWLRANDLRYAYIADRDVLHGIDLDLEPGERVAVVGPSGAGKSTLGRLLAGIHPPRVGRVEVGGVRLVDLPLDTLRKEVALVTQEQHVFVGTLAENAAVDALEWAQALPNALETVVGTGGLPLTPAQAQQVALARLVLADPHTLVLDEATSLLDPRAARHLERSLAAVLGGRTVVAIAHRLHTAHDADRVAVVEEGLLQEVGTHDELVERAGSYASLWDSWHGDRGGGSRG
jgi:ABC-type multidrug transport system fused ATPase/permease subunit